MVSWTSKILVLKEYKHVFELTKDEPDFPRKLLKYYNVNLSSSSDKLKASDLAVMEK